MGRIIGWKAVLSTLILLVFVLETILLFQPMPGSPESTTVESALPIIYPISETVTQKYIGESLGEDTKGSTVQNHESITSIDSEVTDTQAGWSSPGSFGIYPFLNLQRDTTYYWVDLGGYGDYKSAGLYQQAFQKVEVYTTMQPLGDGAVHLFLGPFESYSVAEEATLGLRETLATVQLPE